MIILGIYIRRIISAYSLLGHAQVPIGLNLMRNMQYRASTFVKLNVKTDAVGKADLDLVGQFVMVKGIHTSIGQEMVLGGKCLVLEGDPVVVNVQFLFSFDRLHFIDAALGAVAKLIAAFFRE